MTSASEYYRTVGERGFNIHVTELEYFKIRKLALKHNRYVTQECRHLIEETVRDEKGQV